MPSARTKSAGNFGFLESRIRLGKIAFLWKSNDVRFSELPNALLVPYGISKNSLSEIEATYKPLADTGRLVVPGQVAREFARNRPVKIGDIFQALSRKRNLKSPERGRYPLLEDVPSYARLQELEQQIDTIIGEYREAISELLDHIRRWTWNDPVSQLYSRIFPDIIVDPPLKEDEVRERLDYQNVNKLPPGYKDASKPDQGVGDLLVWQVVVHVAEERKQSVVLVSRDAKADWFYRSENEPLFPRFELVDEIQRVSGGKSLHIVSFSKFLELFGATAEAVGEVRKEEIKVDLSTMSRHGRLAIKAHLAEQEVADWLRETYPHIDLARDERTGDFVWSERGGASILVSVKYAQSRHARMLMRQSLARTLERFDRSYKRDDFQFDNILMFFVVDTEAVADSLANTLPRLVADLDHPDAQVVVAHLKERGGLRILDPLNALPVFE